MTPEELQKIYDRLNKLENPTGFDNMSGSAIYRKRLVANGGLSLLNEASLPTTSAIGDLCDLNGVLYSSTGTNIWRPVNQQIYAADAQANDTYVITPAPAIPAYYEGQVFFFKANTKNTGACTLNVNSLGDIGIKKNATSDLADNDIKAGQIVGVVYDGTNFQMFSPIANMPVQTQVLALGGTGSVSSSTTETETVTYTFPQGYLGGNDAVWIRAALSVNVGGTSGDLNVRIRLGDPAIGVASRSAICTLTHTSMGNSGVGLSGPVDFIIKNNNSVSSQVGNGFDILVRDNLGGTGFYAQTTNGTGTASVNTNSGNNKLSLTIQTSNTGMSASVAVGQIILIPSTS